MPEAFSPSRSLKYCRITLRTVSDSSFSLTLSDLVSDFVLCCKRHLVFVVFELCRLREELVEEPRDGRELGLCAIERIHAGAEHGGVLEPLRVPADVLARDLYAALETVESIEVVQVR